MYCLALGCMNPQAFNYDPSANTDNASCIAVVNGCTDATAFNYNPNANTDDNFMYCYSIRMYESTSI